MVRDTWTFLSSHGHALVCMASDPEIRLREMATLIGITERCAQQIVNDLEAMGVIRRSRTGRRNTYEIHREARFRHPLEADLTVGAFLDLVERERSAPAAIAAGVSDPGRTWRSGDAVRPTVSAPSPFGSGVRDRSPDGVERRVPRPGSSVTGAGDGRSPYQVDEVLARGSGSRPPIRTLATESPAGVRILDSRRVADARPGGQPRESGQATFDTPDPGTTSVRSAPQELRS